MRSVETAVAGDDMTVRWETATEIGNLGFNVWRSAQSEAGYGRVNNVLIPSQAVGTGGTRYQFLDRGVPAGTWYYKLETINLDRSILK